MKKLTLMCLCLTATIALALEHNDTTPSFMMFDTDKNGEITRLEFNSVKENIIPDNKDTIKISTYLFHNIDANEDGIIQKEEYIRYSILQQSNESVPDNQCLDG